MNVVSQNNKKANKWKHRTLFGREEKEEQREKPL